jgi:hypothetical protein
MQIRTVDGVAHYAKYLLKTKELPEGDPFFRFPSNEEGIVCFTDRDLARAEAWLKERYVEYEIEKQPAPPNWERTEGVIYGNNEEVLAHIKEDIEPESLVIPRLRERVDAAERRAEAAELKAEAAEQKAERAEGMARAAESRLETLEKDIKLTK